jgi:hypothetical protein
MIVCSQKRNTPRFALLSSAGLITALAVGTGVLTPTSSAAQEGKLIIATPADGSGGGGIVAFGGPAMALNSKPSLVNAPITAMTPYFGLTDEQAKKIEEIQKSARPDFKSLLKDAIKVSDDDKQVTTTPDGRTIKTFSIRLDPEKAREMEAKAREQSAKMQQDFERAEKEIELVLTPDQRPGVNPFLRDLELFQGAMLPAELIRDLDLNGPQKRKLQIIVRDARAERDQRMKAMVEQARQSGQIGNIGTMTDWRKEVMEKSRAILTPQQRDIVEKWEKDHPTKYGIPGGGGNVIRLGG